MADWSDDRESENVREPADRAGRSGRGEACGEKPAGRSGRRMVPEISPQAAEIRSGGASGRLISAGRLENRVDWTSGASGT
jgi:hypothetical protein